MLTLSMLLVLAAFVVTVSAAMGKAPLWVVVFLLVVLELMRLMPIR